MKASLPLDPLGSGHSQIVNDFVLVQTALGVVCCVSSLRVFGENRLMHWREASTGGQADGRTAMPHAGVSLTTGVLCGAQT